MENVFLFVPNLIGIEFPQAITSRQRVTSGYSGVCSMTNQLVERSPSGLSTQASTPTKRLIRNGWLGKLIGYARIILAAIAFCLMRSLPGVAFSLYLLSGFLDAFDGFAARALNQGSRFGAMLDMLTDRCATACLIVNLALLYPSATPLFQLSLSLDVASHWLHLHSSVLKGSESHKNLGGKASRLLGLYYKSRVEKVFQSVPQKPSALLQLFGLCVPLSCTLKRATKTALRPEQLVSTMPSNFPLTSTSLVLFLMCAGNELFYSCLFLNYHYSGPIVPGLQLGLLPLLVVIFSPVAILKAVIALMQLLAASATIAEVDRVERERVVKRK